MLEFRTEEGISSRSLGAPAMGFWNSLQKGGLFYAVNVDRWLRALKQMLMGSYYSVDEAVNQIRMLFLGLELIQVRHFIVLPRSSRIMASWPLCRPKRARFRCMRATRSLGQRT